MNSLRPVQRTIYPFSHQCIGQGQCSENRSDCREWSSTLFIFVFNSFFGSLVLWCNNIAHWFQRQITSGPKPITRQCKLAFNYFTGFRDDTRRRWSLLDAKLPRDSYFWRSVSDRSPWHWSEEVLFHAYYWCHGYNEFRAKSARNPIWKVLSFFCYSAQIPWQRSKMWMSVCLRRKRKKKETEYKFLRQRDKEKVHQGTKGLERGFLQMGMMNPCQDERANWVMNSVPACHPKLCVPLHLFMYIIVSSQPVILGSIYIN